MGRIMAVRSKQTNRQRYWFVYSMANERAHSLLVALLISLLLVVVDLEVAQLVRVLGGRDDTQPVPELVLLQVLLGEVLQVSLREGNIRGYDQFRLLLFQHNVGPQVACLASNFNAFQQELLKASDVHDAILNRKSAVESKLQYSLLLLASSRFRNWLSLGLSSGRHF